MNEVDFTGWTRTEAELDRLVSDKGYRLKRNLVRLTESIKQSRGDLLYYLDCWLFNKNDF